MKLIRTAVIGFGMAGRVFHTPLVAAEPRFSREAIVTSSTLRMAEARTLYPQTEIISSPEELFSGASEFDLG
ncbi:hypothetical protein [Arthrobacter sp. M4]|uniref:hypothetical protein n=1 Tax=Arthrobacter sp. M4 TaxID=218160 RepID=UPI001CDB832A|nr:hypothetical protein [Arthrobacter sp. M4]MCA4132545.1 hypothetical protein [Arthrobacter sp. M4]